jgi:peptidoglycan/xylan/chitin deacetylase (PgdA/CDA1 family)
VFRPLPILMYHSVDTQSSETYSRWVVSPDQLARHLEVLTAGDYLPVTISQLAAAIGRREVLPAKTVAITFDDGLRDFLTHAMPVLQRYRCPATLFVVTGCVGGTSRWLQHLGEGGRPMLTWQELRDISESGIECGAHTHTHAQLDILPAPAAFQEIHTSKHALEDQLGRPVKAFAYPHGYASRATRHLVRQAGFASACRVRHALSTAHEDLFALSRVVMTDHIDENRLDHMLNGDGGLPIAPPLDRLVAYGWRLARRLRRRFEGQRRFVATSP